jgi:TRAP transporter TAXI family solute receptor
MSKLERYLPALLVGLGVTLLAAVVIQFFRTAPPRTITFLAGRPGGAYWTGAQRYAEYAAGVGFTIDVVETAGSVEALQMLQEGKGDVAFVQGGIAAMGDPELVSALFTVAYEPVWIFYRRELAEGDVLTSPLDLKGTRINIGEQGSGTNPLARELLADYEVTDANTTLRELPTAEAVDAMRAGELDAVIAVLNVVSPVLQDLIEDPRVELMSLADAAALVRRHRFLSRLTLPRGTINLVEMTPREDTRLVTTQANMVIRNDLHPDIIRLLTYAAVDIHSAGGFFEARGEFPSVLNADLPISKEGETYLMRIKNREFTLDRYLPFWASALFDRYLLFVVPLLLIILPLISRSPLLFQVYQRRKINRWYKEVRKIETNVDAMSLTELRSAIRSIDELSDRLLQVISVTTEFMPNLYALRTHIGYVETRLQKREAALMAEGMPRPPNAAPAPPSA